MLLLNRRDARVVDWGGLENRCPGNWTVGSNPSLSATVADYLILTKARDQIRDQRGLKSRKTARISCGLFL